MKRLKKERMKDEEIRGRDWKMGRMEKRIKKERLEDTEERKIKRLEDGGKKENGEIRRKKRMKD